MTDKKHKPSVRLSMETFENTSMEVPEEPGSDPLTDGSNPPRRPGLSPSGGGGGGGHHHQRYHHQRVLSGTPPPSALVSPGNSEHGTLQPHMARPRHERNASTISFDMLSQQDDSGAFPPLHSHTHSGALTSGTHRTPRSRRSSVFGRRREEVIPPKPYGSKIQQQTLPSFAPLISPRYMLTCYFLVFAVFIPLGAVMIADSDRLAEIEVQYDHLNQYTIQKGQLFSFTAGNVTSTQGVKTYAKFTVDRTIPGPVYLYYKIHNFFQNHRDFRNSRSLRQMAGVDIAKGALVPCLPLRSPGEMTEGDEELPIVVNGENKTLADLTYVPCGLGAWSKFNDSFSIYRVGDRGVLDGATATGGNDLAVFVNASNTSLLCDTADFDVDGNPISQKANNCSKKGIALDVDRDGSHYARAEANPLHWSAHSNVTTDNAFLAQRYYQGEPGHSLPDVIDEDLMVWLRVAPLYEFKKFFRYINGDLQAGDYILEVTELWDVTSFKGKKFMVIQSRDWMGGRNIFLGAAFVFIGSLAFLFFVAFGLRALTRPKHWRQTKAVDDGHGGRKRTQ